MSRLSALERSILDHAGCAAADVASALGIGCRRVELVRERCGRSPADGLPPAPTAAPPLTEVDYDELMRSNRGVC